MRWDGLIPFYGTKDLMRTHEFYSGLLGLSLYKDQKTCRIYEVRPGAYVGFCLHHPVVPEHLSPMITLLTPDVDAVFEHFVRAGVEVDKQPAVNPKYNIYHFFAKDPNGYKVEVQMFLD